MPLASQKSAADLEKKNIKKFEKKHKKTEGLVLTHANVASSAAKREKDTCPPPCSDAGLRSHCKIFVVLFFFFVLFPLLKWGTSCANDFSNI